MSFPRTNHLREPELDFWWEQFLAKLYLPRGRCLDYRGPFPGNQKVNAKTKQKIAVILDIEENLSQIQPIQPQ
jgi:hypothetical protein